MDVGLSPREGDSMRRCAFVLLFLLLARPAAATFIVQDLAPGSGDQLLILDTNTGLGWLKLTATAGQSVNSVLGGFGGFQAAGLQYATSAQVQTLFADAGGFLYGDGAPGEWQPANDFIALFGATQSYPNNTDEWAEGLYGVNEPGAGLAYVANVERTTTFSQGGYFELPVATVDFNATSQDAIPLGSYLVMAVPEPGAGTLASLGVLAITLARRGLLRRFLRSSFACEPRGGPSGAPRG
jgi:hypothetical protein